MPSYDSVYTQVKPRHVVADFNRFTLRKPNNNVRPYPMPEIYDHQKVLKGYEKLAHSHRPIGFVSLDKGKARDEVMYGFDKETIRKIKLHLNKNDFNFSTYLPNGLSKHFETSRGSFASTATTNIKNLHRNHSRNDDSSPNQMKDHGSIN